MINNTSAASIRRLAEGKGAPTNDNNDGSNYIINMITSILLPRNLIAFPKLVLALKLTKQPRIELRLLAKHCYLALKPCLFDAADEDEHNRTIFSLIRPQRGE